MKLCIYVIALLTAGIHCAQAELAGARAILESVEQEELSQATGKDRAKALRDKLDALHAKGGELDERTHLGEFNALLDQWIELLGEGVSLFESRAPWMGGGGAGLGLVVKALPPPAVWSELDLASAAKDPRHKNILAAVNAALVRDEPALREIVVELSSEPSAGAGVDAAFYMAPESGGEIHETFLNVYHWDEWYLSWLESQFAESEEGGSPKPEYAPGFQVPNLVRLYGEEKAAGLLVTMLTSTKHDLEFYSAGTLTTRLAQKLAVERVDELPGPIWALAQDAGAVEVFEAFDKAFPDAGEDDPFGYERQMALGYYLVGLIISGESEKADELLKSSDGKQLEGLPYESHQLLAARGEAGVMAEFLHEQLAAQPELPFWNAYFKLAAMAGLTQEAAKLLTETIESGKASASTREELESRWTDVLLANGDVDQALERLKDEGDWPRIIRLGVTLGRAELVDSALAQLIEAADAGDPETFQGWSVIPVGESERFEESEQLLQAALKTAVSGSGSAQSYGSSGASEILQQLVQLYYAADRPEDVLYLADHAPQWEVDDAAGIEGGIGNSSQPFLFTIAWALAKTGREAQAIQALEYVLASYPGFDPAYELYLSLKGKEALPYFQKLFQMDPYEERPLIWQAAFHLSENELEQAERLARQAIAVDPSDGEQGPGDRLRAYAVLAEIKAGQGQIQESIQLREAVAAIRLAEEADRYRLVGLTGRAIEMYRESLTRFSDAYCIQSRLAVELAQRGEIEAAAAHYRKAFELMPESFGRVESHCFGCEGVFAGAGAPIAERVFVEMLERMPDRPQLHYLYGYLQMQRGNHAEAEAPLWRAVELDPEYLNAWVKLYELGDNVALTVEQRDQIVLQILELDPLSRHSAFYEIAVADMAGLWRTAREGLARTPQLADEFSYPLQAAKARLSNAAEANDAEDFGDYTGSSALMQRYGLSLL